MRNHEILEELQTVSGEYDKLMDDGKSYINALYPTTSFFSGPLTQLRYLGARKALYKRRGTLIVKACERGATLRSIAEVTGMSFENVTNIRDEHS
jgi:hypothetical protein